MTHDAITVPDAPRTRLTSPGFLGLLATQFLTAMNDNVFRWLAVAFAKTAPELSEATALTIGLVCFTVPYLVLANVAGHLADRFAKRRVIVVCKFAEIVLMGLGVVAILSGNVWFLFAVVAAMGAQSALFSPAKLGALPEIVRRDRLSAANGVMGLCTIVACAIGFVVGNLLYSQIGSPQLDSSVSLGTLGPAVGVILGVAVLGWLASLLVVTPPAADPDRKLGSNPIAETGKQLGTLWANPAIFKTALGIGFFWLLASLAQTTMDPYGTDVLHGGQKEVGILGGILVLGVGLGCVIAGLWSGKAVELGIVPIGGVGIVVSSLLLWWTGSGIDWSAADAGSDAFFWSCVWLFCLGVGSGMFDVPLETNLQHRSPHDERGTILAASNFVSFSFILVSAGLFYLLTEVLQLSASTVFLVAGLGTIPVLVYIVVLIPQAVIRTIFWVFIQIFYRLRVRGKHNVPEEGGALLVFNHLTWLDGALILLVSDRPVRMLVYGEFFKDDWLGWLLRLHGCLPIRSTAPKEMMRSLQDARKAVEAGELVGIFAEGQLSRTGQTQTFMPGMMRILKGTGAPVIPVYLDELWGSIFSYSGGTFFNKRPRRWPYPISITFGPALYDVKDPFEVRQCVLELGSESVEHRKDRAMVPQRRFLRQCRSAGSRAKIADSAGLELDGKNLLLRALVFRMLVNKVVGKDEKFVGLLVPPSVGGALANLSLALAKKVSVNLNYTLNEETVNFCIKEAGIKHVLTSKRFMEKRPMNLDAEVVYLEDLKEQVTGGMKAAAAMQVYATPTWLLERMLGLTSIQPDDLLTIIFTSGSTGTPKGVMLSHQNVGSNIDAVQQVLQFTDEDVLLGVLPFFHSFGYTVGLWLIACLQPKAVYHFNPLDSRTVAQLSKDHGVSLLVATPTFLRGYTKRCTPEDFHKLRLVVVGAEKLPLDVAEAFQQKFGVLPSEGYGTTELSPVAAVNIQGYQDELVTQPGTKLGSVGRPIPGVTAKVVDPDTGADLGVDTDGLLLITGPNVMRGYLNQPEKTAEVLRDGWYVTGDIAHLDADGFIVITGRQSRFSKIGGEMVPHIRVEEILNRLAQPEGDTDQQLKVAVTSLPDEKKGEKLAVLHVADLGCSIEELLDRFGHEDVPNIWRPGRDAFVAVDEIPILGSGKLDLAGCKTIAEERLKPSGVS